MILKPFSSFLIPLEEIIEFYRHDGELPKNRPYAWSNTLRTFDGIISFLDSDTTLENISLSGVEQVGNDCKADFRLLVGSWMFSDAIIISEKVAIADPNFSCILSFQDIREYRTNVLKKEPPIVVLLMSSGNLPLKSAIFQIPELKVVAYCQSSLYESLNNSLPLAKSRVELVSMNELNLGTILEQLKKRGIDYLDVCVGGKWINTFINHGYLDEIKSTTAGQIIGPFNLLNEERPKLFPQEMKSFNHKNSPLVKNLGMRYLGDYFVFQRSQLIYRHLDSKLNQEQR